MAGTLATSILSFKAHFDTLSEEDNFELFSEEEYDDYIDADVDDDGVPYQEVSKQISHPRRIGKLQKPLQASSLLSALPNDVWSDDVLKFLDKHSVRTFLTAIGRTNIQVMGLQDRFCTRHGSKLESASFLFCNNDDKKNENNSRLITQDSKLECADCYMQANNLTRCRTCHVFYPRYPCSSSLPQGPPHLWCQKCNEMAFCNSCMSHDTACCGSGNSICRVTKCNHCCPNVLTNTMCGEYVCTDCNSQHNDPKLQSLDCDVCGKAACLDPNCLVCGHARLLYEDLGENAYGVPGNSRSSTASCYLGQAFSWISLWVMIVVMAWTFHGGVQYAMEGSVS
eukprot:scaffold586_cov68-Cylindrotheca_fusiformis.AAC.9